jgi:trigger factor
LTTNNQTSFQNDSIQVSLKKEPGCKTLLEVNVTPEATKASYQKAIAIIKKEVSVPGFRKGKAPDDMILKNYEKHVEKEWKDVLLNTSFDEAIRLVKIAPFNRNSIKSANIVSVSQQNGSKLTFEYESAPEIPVIAPETLTIPAVELKKITQKDVDAAIEDLSLQSAQWNEINDRPVGEDDFVLVDIDDIGESPKNLCTSTLFSMKKGKMGEWMRKLVLGMSPGDTREGMSENDNKDCAACEDGSHNHTHDDNFVPTLCRITLHSIRHAIPHALDDALAQKYGAENFQDLTEKVQKSLENRAQEEQKDQERRFMEVEILKNYPFDMPASLIQGELNGVRKTIIQELTAEGVESSKIPEEVKKIELQAAHKYDRDFRLYFLTQKYAKENQVEVSKDEVMMEVMRQMWLKQMGQNTIDTSLDQNEMQAQMAMQLLAMKAIDQMIEKAGKTSKKA